LEETACPLTDSVEGKKHVLGPAAVGAEQGLSQARMAFVHPILSASRTQSARRGSLGGHQQVHEVWELHQPLPEIIILILGDQVRQGEGRSETHALARDLGSWRGGMSPPAKSKFWSSAS